MNPELASEYADALGNRGIRILRNESHEVAGLTLVGLDDLWTGRFHPSSDMRAPTSAGPAWF